MDELINKITERTGLQPEQARGAADAVLEFLKARLPAPIATNLDSIVSGGATAEAVGGMLESATAKLGSVLRTSSDGVLTFADVFGRRLQHFRCIGGGSILPAYPVTPL